MSDRGEGNRPVALVMGFGPFGEVVDNPSCALATALDGTLAGPFRIAGRTMPVSYRRCLETTAAAVAELAPTVVLGIGVAVRRERARLERVGRARVTRQPLDVDGRMADWRSAPHLRRPARLPLDRMCAASGLGLSEDCGSYVCNGWLYACLGMLPERVRIGFLHVPRAGVSADVVRRALAVVPVGKDGFDGLRRV